MIVPMRRKICFISGRDQCGHCWPIVSSISILANNCIINRHGRWPCFLCCLLFIALAAWSELAPNTHVAIQSLAIEKKGVESTTLNDFHFFQIDFFHRFVSERREDSMRAIDRIPNSFFVLFFSFISSAICEWKPIEAGDTFQLGKCAATNPNIHGQWSNHPTTIATAKNKKKEMYRAAGLPTSYHKKLLIDCWKRFDSFRKLDEMKKIEQFIQNNHCYFVFWSNFNISRMRSQLYDELVSPFGPLLPYSCYGTPPMPPAWPPIALLIQYSFHQMRSFFRFYYGARSSALYSNFGANRSTKNHASIMWIYIFLHSYHAVSNMHGIQIALSTLWAKSTKVRWWTAHGHKRAW